MVLGIFTQDENVYDLGSNFVEYAHDCSLE
jgi:hypothetical protein